MTTSASVEINQAPEALRLIGFSVYRVYRVDGVYRDYRVYRVYLGFIRLRDPRRNGSHRNSVFVERREPATSERSAILPSPIGEKRANRLY